MKWILSRRDNLLVEKETEPKHKIPHAAARILSCGTALVEPRLTETVIHKSSR